MKYDAPRSGYWVTVDAPDEKAARKHVRKWMSTGEFISRARNE